MGKVAYINRCILMDNLHIPSSGSTMSTVECHASSPDPSAHNQGTHGAP
jgi:hypothetical protein